MHDTSFGSWMFYTIAGLTVLLVFAGSAGRDWVYRNKYKSFKRKP
jgi:hypothetical protein